jgi:phosphoribosylformylglycinamidine cyclo-ligase
METFRLMRETITYKDAGVDVELADSVLGSLSPRIRSTFGPEVIGKFGGFAALVRPDWARYREPVLVSSTDGVGTKLKIAFMTGVHDTIGIDLTAMNVNDVLTVGARPLFMLDYFATGAIEPETTRSVIGGIVRGCEIAGCALIGGETAEMPDFYAPGEYDLAGFCVGVVDRDMIPDSSNVKPGQAVVGLASTGLHSNGYSLVRKALLGKGGYALTDYLPDLGRTLGEELLQPTQIYVQPVLELLAQIRIHGMAHITGGGFIGNIPRVLPEACSVVIRRGTWEKPPIFDILQRETNLDDHEMFRTFNMGVGLVLILNADDADKAVRSLEERGIRSWVIGEVTARVDPSAALSLD